MGRHIQHFGGEEKIQPGILYPVKSFFKTEEKFLKLPNKLKQKEFIASRLALRRMLKGVLHVTMKGH